MTTKLDAIRSLKPGAEFVLEGDSVKWIDSKQTEPTSKEIDEEIKRLDSDYAAKKYQRDRKAEYPSIVDQLDDIYHNGIDAWKATIKKTKDKYPKS